MPEQDHTKKAAANVRRSLETLVGRLADTRSIRDGDVVMRLTGDSGGTYLLSCRGGKVKLADAAMTGTEKTPLLEVMGDAETIRSILEGESDARERFFAGGLRVRGDLRYLSTVGLELGLLKEPL